MQKRTRRWVYGIASGITLAVLALFIGGFVGGVVFACALVGVSFDLLTLYEDRQREKKALREMANIHGKEKQ